MTSRLQSDLAATLDRRRLLGALALGAGGAMLAACGTRAGAQALACPATPTETKGPFPADGTNGRPRPINVLNLDGVIRRDIRPSFAGLEGRAEGAALELELALVGTADCAPARAGAIYLWQNDATGDYSLYDRTDVNYLRGLQPAEGGRVRFTSVVPGCYGGRYPHCHLEVFAGVEAAMRGEAPLLVSQLAFPEAECRALYQGDARYGDSLRNLDRLPIERDFVFADSDAEGRARQTIVLKGDPQRGFAGSATVVLG
ncbi:MAG: intradiol ring-cleavage dioxygenase [Altererythrobacter sp.]|nr:intradiol ring-cleavage dioxygenase [Altererythrobacter sp.]